MLENINGIFLVEEYIKLQNFKSSAERRCGGGMLFKIINPVHGEQQVHQTVTELIAFSS